MSLGTLATTLRRNRAVRGRLRWYMISFVFAGLVINYLDRAGLGVALPFMGETFRLSKTQEGMILAAFFWSYDFCQLAAGWFVDRHGPRKTFTFAAVWWSIFTSLTAAASSFATLFGVRLLLGVGESPAATTSAKVVGRWFPRHERALATGIWDSGSRGAFGWWRTYRDPQEHPRVSEEELAYLREGGARWEGDAGDERTRWRDLFRHRTIWAMMLGFFCLNMVVYFFLTFFPTYLVEERGFSLLKLGLFGALPGLVAIGGEWLGGWLADRRIARGESVTRVRKTFIAGGFLVSTVIGVAVWVPAAWMALALLSVAYAGSTFAAANIWSLPADVAPSDRQVASIGGIQNFASNFAGIIGPIMVGYLVDVTSSFTVPLMVIAAVALLGAFTYAVVLKRVEPIGAPPAAAGR
ncbi:MFS transporter [Actinomadura sp. ATCC 31491]|uniref:MFS transporter n=1 Tax=Actinomadura luzonensis TaxID=2805427 RepID=A0ABT0FY71_9ACTN|nr:MFS transporter [Actinomadura luzonensis]MCK2217301.1 MFS transporter [Actinomadura luzonensis]